MTIENRIGKCFILKTACYIWSMLYNHCYMNGTALHTIFFKDILAIVGWILFAKPKTGVGFAEWALVFEIITIL